MRILRISHGDMLRLSQAAGWLDQGAVEIERYGRFWAVYFRGELLAVVLYRKGAERIREVIEGLIAKAEPRPAPAEPRQAWGVPA